MDRNKSDKLGVPFGTASNRLHKQLLFKLVSDLNLNICFRCSLPIQTANTLTIDHKIDWLNSPNPQELFWSLDNIAFSHKTCNVPTSGRKIVGEIGTYWCFQCRSFKLREMFASDKSRKDGIKRVCRSCQSTYDKTRKEVRQNRRKLLQKQRETA